jgi:hypothetical protein
VRCFRLEIIFRLNLENFMLYRLKLTEALKLFKVENLLKNLNSVSSKFSKFIDDQLRTTRLTYLIQKV